jgi:hypothetical protein
MQTDAYKLRILELAQLWRMNLLKKDEVLELETWFRSLEDKELGSPIAMTVDKLELRLHQLLANKFEKPDENDPNCPPYPFK